MMNPVRYTTLVAALAAATPLTVLSKEHQPFVVGGIEISRDSDDLRIEGYSAGGGIYTNASSNDDRIGYRHGETHYSHLGSRTRGSSDSIFASREITLLGGIDISGELTQSRLDTDQDEWLGWAQISGQPNQASNIELRYEKNWVDSGNGLSDGITYSMLSMAGDYQLTDRLNLAGVIGHLDFSNGNDRPLYRIKGSWVLSETYGISVYARARRYTNSNPYNGYYFSPERFQDYLGGFGIRRRLPMIRGTLTGQIDWGRQSADGETSPARTWQLRLESWLGTRWSYAIATGYNATAGVGGGDNYRYRYASASVTWAF